MATDPMRHFERNRDEYNQIADMLSDVNASFMSASRSTQKSMLFDSSVFAVMSVQNSIDMLRRAFMEYAMSKSWSDATDAFSHLNYGNSKLDYARDNRETINSVVGDNIISRLESGNVWDAVSLMVDELVGVSWVKASFIPAMLGFTDVMCVDTNVEQMVPDDRVFSRGYGSLDEYRTAVKLVLNEFPVLSNTASPFMVQWVVFDANRGDGVAKHLEWFDQMLPGTPFGRQTTLDSY